LSLEAVAVEYMTKIMEQAVQEQEECVSHMDVVLFLK
jgi:hypothetical protein